MGMLTLVVGINLPALNLIPHHFQKIIEVKLTPSDIYISANAYLQACGQLTKGHKISADDNLIHASRP